MVAGVPNASAIQLDTSDVTKLEECVAKVHRRRLPIAFLIWSFMGSSTNCAKVFLDLLVI